MPPPGVTELRDLTLPPDTLAHRVTKKVGGPLSGRNAQIDTVAWFAVTGATAAEAHRNALAARAATILNGEPMGDGPALICPRHVEADVAVPMTPNAVPPGQSRTPGSGWTGRVTVVPIPAGWPAWRPTRAPSSVHCGTTSAWSPVARPSCSRPSGGDVQARAARARRRRPELRRRPVRPARGGRARPHRRGRHAPTSARCTPTCRRTEAATLAYARGLLRWHRFQQYCGRCGSPAETRNGGHFRVCTNPDCAQLLFPRIEPAIITLVESAREPHRCLLARHRASKTGGFSLLAGFVEIGESLEDAVRREIHEEAGIAADGRDLRRFAAVAVSGRDHGRLPRGHRGRDHHRRR